MGFDPNQFTAVTIASFNVALKAAYDQGVQDGIARIVAAAQAPIAFQSEPAVTHPVAEAAHATREIVRRAPRGLVPTVVERMLTDHPGKIIADYELLVASYDPRVSAKSIGNELRRHDGEKYRRDSASGWFLMSGNSEAGVVVSQPSPASDSTNQGGLYGTALAS